MSDVLAFTIEGVPPSGNRASRIGLRGAYTPREVIEYRERIASIAFAEIVRQKFPRAEWFTLEVTAYNVRSDCDNLCAEILDGLQGVVYESDHRVIDLHVRKQKDKAGTRVAVRITHADAIAAGYEKAPRAKRVALRDAT